MSFVDEYIDDTVPFSSTDWHAGSEGQGLLMSEHMTTLVKRRESRKEVLNVNNNNNNNNNMGWNVSCAPCTRIYRRTKN